MNRIARIGANELTRGMTLLGDSICPTRYGFGTRVSVANTEGDYTYTITADVNVVLVAAETVYVLANDNGTVKIS
jgi:hypothetical protein